MITPAQAKMLRSFRIKRYAVLPDNKVRAELLKLKVIRLVSPTVYELTPKGKKEVVK